jgi:hypothetical protein
MRLSRALVLILLLPACTEEGAERPPAAAPPPATNIYVVDSAVEGAEAPDARARTRPQEEIDRILITPDKHLDRPTEVLGVFDFHTAATSEDKGFAELRRKAAALGADAVIGAEFEHGEGNEPSHLSGMAVRYR